MAQHTRDFRKLVVTPLESGGKTPLWRARNERVGQSLAIPTVCPPEGPARAGSCPRTPEAPLVSPKVRVFESAL